MPTLKLGLVTLEKPARIRDFQSIQLKKIPIPSLHSLKLMKKHVNMHCLTTAGGCAPFSHSVWIGYAALQLLLTAVGVCFVLLC